jgi:hypothetical protein
VRILFFSPYGDGGGLDVGPRIFSENLFYRRIRNLYGECFPYLVGIVSALPHLPHFFYKGVCQFRTIGSLSPSSSEAPIPVFHILFMRSTVKMINSAAKSVVAFVEYHFPVRDRTILKNPYKSVRAIAVKINGILTVPSEGSSSPNPAGLGLFNPGPESVYVFLGYLLGHDVVLSI